MEYSGFWRRFAAGIIDTILCICFYLALMALTKLSFFYENLIYQSVIIFYFVGLIASRYHATFGLLIMRSKILTPDYRALSLPQSLIRYIIWGLPFWPFVIYSSMPLFSDTMANLDAIPPENHEQYLNYFSSLEVQNVMITSGILFGIGVISSFIWFLPIAFTRQKTGIHDMICRTRVFKV